MMTLNEAKEVFINRAFIPTDDGSGRIYDPDKWREACYVISKWLEQEPCEMTVEEYRQRMIQAFHNADCDELIAICALPTEKEFEHLEWLLKNHYKKKEPCEAISRQAAIEAVEDCLEILENLPLITPQPKTGYWISGQKETGALGVTYTEKIYSTCGWNHSLVIPKNYCPKCGTKMTESE